MIRSLNMGITRQPYSNFAESRRRRGERLDNPPEPGPEPPQPPAKLHPREQSLYALAGEVLRTFAPHTGAHPAAILLQFLAASGYAAGPSPLRATITDASRMTRITGRERTRNLHHGAHKPLRVAFPSQPLNFLT
jgi:hypothetical protein